MNNQETLKELLEKQERRRKEVLRKILQNLGWAFTDKDLNEMLLIIDEFNRLIESEE